MKKESLLLWRRGNIGGRISSFDLGDKTAETVSNSLFSLLLMSVRFGVRRQSQVVIVLFFAELYGGGNFEATYTAQD